MTQQELEEIRRIIREELEKTATAKDVEVNGFGSCPPLGHGCPMMFTYIPAGQSMTCGSCGKRIRSSAPMF